MFVSRAKYRQNLRLVTSLDAQKRCVPKKIHDSYNCLPLLKLIIVNKEKDKLTRKTVKYTYFLIYAGNKNVLSIVSITFDLWITTFRVCISHHSEWT